MLQAEEKTFDLPRVKHLGEKDHGGAECCKQFLGSVVFVLYVSRSSSKSENGCGLRKQVQVLYPFTHAMSQVLLLLLLAAEGGAGAPEVCDQHLQGEQECATHQARQVRLGQRALSCTEFKSVSYRSKVRNYSLKVFIFDVKFSFFRIINSLLIFFPRFPYSTPSRDFYFMYNIWQEKDAGIRTRVAASAAWCATNELHTSLTSLVLYLLKGRIRLPILLKKYRIRIPPKGRICFHNPKPTRNRYHIYQYTV